MKFIAIDSSLAHTGVAIGNILKDGTIDVRNTLLSSTSKTKLKQVRASSDTIERCRITYNFVHGLIKEHNPAVIFMETPSGSQSAAGMKSYGSTCALIASINPPAIEVTPNEVKIAAVNDKTASKLTMINWAVKNYPDLGWYYYQDKLQSKNEHMADAIAIVYAGVKTNEFIRLQSLIR